MSRSSLCAALFAFALLADAWSGPVSPGLAYLEETPTAALALGPVALLVYRRFASGKNKVE